MKDKFAFGLCVVCIVLLPIFTYLTVYYFVGFNIDIYEGEFEKNNVEIEGRKEMALKIINYNKDMTDYLDLELNERERRHMEDVKKVMEKIDVFYWMCLVIIVLSLGILAKEKLLKKTLLIGGIITIAIPVIVYAVPFDILFNSFHAVFFEPGTWVFEQGDLLPSLFPTWFFYNIAVRIFGIGFIIGGLMALVGWFWK